MLEQGSVSINTKIAQRCFSLRTLDSHEESQGKHKAAIRVCENVIHKPDYKRIYTSYLN